MGGGTLRLRLAAAVRGDRFHGRVRSSTRACAHAGCPEPGEFRAPLLPSGFDGPGEYRWLCLDHVREFNDAYNYFNGMSPDEIAAAQTPYAGWTRAARAFSANPDRPPAWADFADPLEAIQARAANRRKEATRPPMRSEDRDALHTLGLSDEADRKAIRAAYSKLVRRYHPDRNGGDRSHEARLQAVVQAYQTLTRTA